MSATLDPTVRLARNGDGTYAAADGRFHIQPVIMGDSPRSKGHREWMITDITGATPFKRSTSNTDTCIEYALFAARDRIAYVLRTEAEATAL